MQTAIQKTPEQKLEIRKKKEHAFRMWQRCIRLAWLQVEFGGTFYIEQPQRSMSWRLQDNKPGIFWTNYPRIAYVTNVLMA